MTSSEPSSSAVVLSVLIPAYNFAPGVRRIVSPLVAEGRNDVEIIIHDDSTEDEVERFVNSVTSRHPNLRYRRNEPTLGAVENWNGLLARARGRYVILVHHDDFPLSEQFSTEVIEELEREGWPDVMLLTCIAYDQECQHVKFNVWNGLRRWVSQAWPAYLLRRNVIGPPSAVVLRREVSQSFDPTLTWLVDVEAYCRVLSGRERRIVMSHQVMISSMGRRDSITRSIHSESSRITAAELSYIANKHSLCRRDRIIVDQSLSARLAMRLEWVVWGAIRLVSALCRVVTGPQTSLTDIEHRQGQIRDG